MAQREEFCCNPKCPNHKYLIHPKAMQMQMHMATIPKFVGYLPPSEMAKQSLSVKHTTITMTRHRFERVVGNTKISGVFCEVCTEALAMMSYDGEMEFPE